MCVKTSPRCWVRRIHRPPALTQYAGLMMFKSKASSSRLLLTFLASSRNRRRIVDLLLLRQLHQTPGKYGSKIEKCYPNINLIYGNNLPLLHPLLRISSSLLDPLRSLESSRNGIRKKKRNESMRVKLFVDKILLSLFDTVKKGGEKSGSE